MTIGYYVSLLIFIGMKDFCITYTHSLGMAELFCYSWELAGILSNMAMMAINGHSFSNVTINKL